MSEPAKSWGIRRRLGDSLASGMIIMVVVAVMQRSVGFIRSLLFCRLLDDSQLGRWSLAQSFLLLAAPLIVLGIPGTFGRYVEHYRQQGRLSLLVRRTFVVCGVLLAVAVACLTQFAEQLGWMVFNDSGQLRLMQWLLLALLIVTASNFVIELLIAMRQVRAVALLQFFSSLTFALVAIGLLWSVDGRELSVVAGYACGALLVVVAGSWLLWRNWQHDEPADADQPPALWSKLLPFAAWIWITNLLANLFGAADRFMIVHWAGDGVGSEALVGQYHSSRVVPLMLVGLAGMLSGVALPYLSKEWEAKRIDRVHRLLNRLMQVCAIAFTAAGVLVLWFSPWLFGWLLQGRYDEGLQVLPWALVASIWFSLFMMAQNYIWCAEKAGWSTLTLGLGLVLNVLLNAWWLPRLGLPGAVMATATANLVTVIGILIAAWYSGMRWEFRSAWLVVLPLSLLLGPLPAAACLVVSAWLVWQQSAAAWFSQPALPSTA